MQVFHQHSPLGEVFGEVFGHFLRQGRDQHSLVLFTANQNFFHQVIDLTFGGFNHDLGVNETGGANDLFDHSIGALQFIGSGGGRKINGLPNAFLEFFPFQRPVIHR